METCSGQISKLTAYLQELTNLNSTMGLLEWDQAVNMPPNHRGHQARANLSAYIAGLRHQKAISPEFEKLFREAKQKADEGLLSDNEKCIFTSALEDFERDKKLPLELVEEQKRVEAETQRVWETAKERSDFKIFEPSLRKIVALKRREANYLREGGQTLYDALLDDYEPGYNTAKLEIIFRDLKDFLVPFIQKIRGSSSWVKPDIIKKPVDISLQMKFAKLVARKIGYDINSGSINLSAHPFSTSFHPTDARVTTRCKRRNFVNDCVLSLVHECGHAMYEQGLLPEFFGTSMAEPVSFGVHESQSRLWENIVGHSMPFWMYFYPKMQIMVPQFKKISLAEFYGAINCVQPSLIRVDADEVTYNLHIVLRFEIEKLLIEGQIEVEDLPIVWNQKVQEYLGVEVKNDSEGVLQDVHWSGGSFGYFPSYTLGNLYASQLYGAALKDIPELVFKISKGNFKDLLKWLRKNIHIYGKYYSTDELLVKVTGQEFSAMPFVDYIKNKYSQLYNI